MQNVLLVGFGFMGRMHASILGRLPNVRLVGIVDPRGQEIRRDLFGSGCQETPVFEDLDTAFASTESSVVDICLPTDLHLEAAGKAFQNGCHVFCEKPIALSVEHGRAMVKAARLAEKQLMVGHCIRFWPEYEVLKQAVDSGEYGRLCSLSLSRRNSRPNYAVGGWVNDPARCVGAALDMHIHDTDFLCFLLGSPKVVRARGIHEETGWNSIASIYDFGDGGPLVFADGAWNYPQGWGFQMSFSAVFEKAALDFDSRATPTLVLTADGCVPEPVSISQEPGDGYHRELAYFFDCLEKGRSVEISTGEQATESLAVVLAEIRSAESGGDPVFLTV
jgi:predicted dehydrogenase